MARTLAVISSNIRYDEPADKLHRWENRREFLSQLLLEYSPDIVATQEGKHVQIQDIAERLTGLRCVDGHRPWIESLMYPCIFYNPATLSLQASGDIWLSEKPTTPGSSSFGSEFPRLCTWAAFEQGIFAMNVHLDNSNSTVRKSQMNVLIEQVRQQLSNDQTLLLMGDFNESPECPVRNLINNEWPELKDPWQELGKQEESSHHNFFEKIDYGTRVDWILTDQELKTQEMILDKSQSKDGLFPSDHYILKARFNWPKE